MGEEGVRTRLRRLPRIDMQRQAEEHHAERERVAQESVVHVPGMCLRRSVGGLAGALAVGAAARERGHGVVREPHGRLAARRVRDEEVLEREVPVHNPELVQQHHRVDHLHHHGVEEVLTVLAGRGLPRAPREQVAPRRQGRHDVHVLRVVEDAVHLAGVGVAPGVELLEQPHVHPGPLRVVPVRAVEGPRPALHPGPAHDLHGDALPAAASHLPLLHAAAVPRGLLQGADEAEGALVPGLRADSQVLHGGLQLLLADGLLRGSLG
mmetsp:Transcript_19724/g.62531  ORF Transcript_19724/g.62531 Transcript_19724/m.62531 type:complete len:266 (-) Transcript_19724:298-1095(-)